MDDKKSPGGSYWFTDKKDGKNTVVHSVDEFLKAVLEGAENSNIIWDEAQVLPNSKEWQEQLDAQFKTLHIHEALVNAYEEKKNQYVTKTVLRNLVQGLNQKDENFFCLVIGGSGNGSVHNALSICEIIDSDFSVNHVLTDPNSLLDALNGKREDIEIWSTIFALDNLAVTISVPAHMLFTVLETSRYKLGYNIVFVAPSMTMVPKNIRNMVTHLIFCHKDGKANMYERSDFIVPGKGILLTLKPPSSQLLQDVHALQMENFEKNFKEVEKTMLNSSYGAWGKPEKIPPS